MRFRRVVFGVLCGVSLVLAMLMAAYIFALKSNPDFEDVVGAVLAPLIVLGGAYAIRYVMTPGPRILVRWGRVAHWTAVCWSISAVTYAAASIAAGVAVHPHRLAIANMVGAAIIFCAGRGLRFVLARE